MVGIGGREGEGQDKWQTPDLNVKEGEGDGRGGKTSPPGFSSRTVSDLWGIFSFWHAKSDASSSALLAIPSATPPRPTDFGPPFHYILHPHLASHDSAPPPLLSRLLSSSSRDISFPKVSPSLFVACLWRVGERRRDICVTCKEANFRAIRLEFEICLPRLEKNIYRITHSNTTPFTSPLVGLGKEKNRP